MDPNSQDYALDPAYSPQIVNEQDNPQPHQDQQNGQYQGSNNNSPMEVDSNSRYNSPSLQYQQPNSRPGSGMSGPQSQYQQDGRPAQQQPSKSSVVIKVGMVGDAQIGKTSLMVKYVEGSWDEDYIQTLGKNTGPNADPHTLTMMLRCKLHGKDNLNPKHRNHLLNMGSRRPARIRQHASPRLQRRCCHPLHVRSHSEVNVE